VDGDLLMPKTLTSWLKELGEEQVTIKINGQEYTCSQIEATARKMYLMANGGTEEIEVKGEKILVTHKPQYQAAKALREFMEGRAAQEAPKEDKKQTTPGQYNSEISRRLNEGLGGGPPKRPSKPVVPKPVYRCNEKGELI
jgi:hypothetical protein